MNEPGFLYRILLAVSEKGLADISRLETGFTLFMRGILASVDPERLRFDLSVSDQWTELIELDLLKSTMAVKELAESEGGFNESHGPALEVAANALFEHCGWENEDISEWFGGLVIGEGVRLEVDFEDEAED